MLQELAIKSTDRILEVGTGSGYMTALLASVGKHVYSVEIVPEFTRSGRGQTRCARHRQRHARESAMPRAAGTNMRPTT